MIPQKGQIMIPSFILNDRLITKMTRSIVKDTVIDLFSHSFSLQSDNDYISLITWMVRAISGEKGYPILTILGDTGTGKTTAGRFIVDILNPADTSVMILPKSPDDLYACAKDKVILMFDHLSHIPPKIGNALYQLSADHPIILTSMYDTLCGKTPLRSKSVMIRTKKPESYMSQRALEKTFQECAPYYRSYLARCRRRVLEKCPTELYLGFGEFRKWVQDHVLFSSGSIYPNIYRDLKMASVALFFLDDEIYGVDQKSSS